MVCILLTLSYKDIQFSLLRYFSFLLGLGNPRGNENPFLLTFGIFWYRFHNHVAQRISDVLFAAYQDPDVKEKFSIKTEYSREDFDRHYDEIIFNEARKWVIATHQVRQF